MLKMAANQGENELLSELKTERIEVPARDAMKEPPKTAGAAQPTSGPHAGAATAKADGPGSTAKDDPGDGNEAAEDDVAMTFPQRVSVCSKVMVGTLFDWTRSQRANPENAMVQTGHPPQFPGRVREGRSDENHVSGS